MMENDSLQAESHSLDQCHVCWARSSVIAKKEHWRSMSLPVQTRYIIEISQNTKPDFNILFIFNEM